MNFWTGVGIGAGGTLLLFAAGIYVLYRILKKCLELDD